MSNFDMEATMIDLIDNIGKADYLSERIIENYNLRKGMCKNQEEAMEFANSRENMCIEMEILCDYIRNIHHSISALREAVRSYE